MAEQLLIKNAAQVVTPLGQTALKGAAMKEVRIYENTSILIEDGRIKAIGNDSSWETEVPVEQQIDATGKTVLPGFVDSHTHFVFGGYRADEFLWRMEGMTYMEIMERGGGINNTMKATRNASAEELIDHSLDILHKMLAFGITTVEGKSGYGMDHDTEIRQLEVMKELEKRQPVEIVRTFLGAHSIPPEYKGRNQEFLQFLVDEVMPEVKQQELAQFCDIFCEKGVFSIEESRKFLQQAKDMGFDLKIHADEIVTLGGAELGAELGCHSADHLLHASDEGIKALANSNTVATLLPTTAFCLKEPFAPARKMIDAGCAVALATDFNPGSGFTNSVPLMIALGVIYMGMTAEEAITALTLNGAAAVGRADQIGSIEEGKQADIVILQYPSYKFLPYHTGVNIVETVIKKGKVVHQA
ncbi:imidazolonepropionase [Veillonella criceti]|uniref:Imidazolonepropionase n=1 Tax=Veillonella criceti TaxID=103891 RepID=A0A380NIJ4_9FIRM|nr:imidazolonepropionase [Veillonella criceti]SUP41903.1 Imidazolonepropionase [Veillonella criceti]